MVLLTDKGFIYTYIYIYGDNALIPTYPLYTQTLCDNSNINTLDLVLLLMRIVTFAYVRQHAI